MTLQFEPKERKELIEERLWADGIYDFEIMGAMQWVSKEEKESIRITFKLSNPDGKSIFINDYLSANNSYGQEKLLNLAQICGIKHLYDRGELNAEDFSNNNGRPGKLQLAIQKSRDPQFSDRNVVKNYIWKDDSISVEEPDFDDSLSF